MSTQLLSSYSDKLNYEENRRGPIRKTRHEGRINRDLKKTVAESNYLHGYVQ
jgi:hypothetical protein